MKNITKIGNYIGQFVKMEDNHTITQPHKFVTVQEIVNIANSLKVGCFITRETRKQPWIPFTYERLSDFF